MRECIAHTRLTKTVYNFSNIINVNTHIENPVTDILGPPLKPPVHYAGNQTRGIPFAQCEIKLHVETNEKKHQHTLTQM